MNYAAILFDMDGTLVDTIEPWITAYLSILQEHGTHLNRTTFMSEIYYVNAHYNDVFANHNIPEKEWAALREERDRRYVELLREQTEWLPGGKEILEALHGKTPLGLFTGSWMSYVDAIDERLGVKHYFDEMVTCDETQGGKSKPNPYGLTLLCKKLQVNPQTCLYIGDQPFDKQAAEGAGMDFCVFAGEHTPLNIVEGAERVVYEGIEILDYADKRGD